MIKVKINSRQFQKDMNNIVKYSLGFLEGVERGKTQFLASLGEGIIQMLKDYVDSAARSNPQMLHHIYEWGKVGAPDSRLYDIEYTISNFGLSFKSTFSQSKSIKEGSTEPFYNKAKIMESGIDVVIRPKRSTVLVFDVDGQTIFTPNPVKVNPGGEATDGSFEKIFDQFFSRYFTQAFLRSSGILKYLENPVLYKKDLPKGKLSGKSAGIKTGYRWIANAGVAR